MKTDGELTRQPLLEYHGIRGEIVTHRVLGFPANALALHLPEPRRSLGGQQGYKKLEAICNCHLPKPLLEDLDERQRDWKAYFRETARTLFGRDLPPHRLAVLSTGVNMKDLAWTTEVYEELWVLALVTAGVETNALRIGRDRAGAIERSGRFERAGTIATIVLTNANLTTAALAASFITITEAKGIALEELDIRSVYTPELRATGTGTDQVLVVSGDGEKCSFAGGHTKLGELMARAVTRATLAAIKNTLTAGRRG